MRFLRYVVDQIIRLFAGRDVFISYARLDAVKYAPALARRLREIGISSYLDQWAAPPDAKLPEAIKRALGRSSVLAVVVGETTAVSSFVREEVQLFIPTRRPIVPIVIEGMPSPSWIPKMVWETETKSDVGKGEVSDAVLSRLRDTAGTMTQSRRLTVSVWFAVVLLALAMGAVVIARSNVKRANVEVAAAKRAKDAADASAKASIRARDEATRDAGHQRAIADATAKANEAGMLLQREPANLPRASMLAAEAMRSFEQLHERSVAADTALRDAYRLLPSIDRTISLKARDSDLIVISPDGRFIAVERAKGMDFIATKERTRKHVSFDGVPSDALRFIVFSADGSTVAAGLVDGKRWFSRVWSTETGRLLSPQIEQMNDLGVESPGAAFALSSNGRLLATHIGSVTRVWDTATGNPLTPPLRESSKYVRVLFGIPVQLLFSPTSDNYLAVSSIGVRVWNWREGTVFTPNVGRDDLIMRVAFSPDERLLGFASYDSVGVCGIGFPFHENLWQVRGMSEPAIAFADRDRMVAVDLNRVAVYDVRDGEVLAAFSPGGVSFALDVHHVVLGALDGTARFFDLTGREVLRAVHTEPVRQIGFVRDENYVVTVSKSVAKVWREREESNDPQWTMSEKQSKTMALSPDGASIALLEAERVSSAIWIHDAISGERKALSVAPDAVVSLSFAGPQYIVATDTRRRLHAWKRAGNELAVITTPPIQADWVVASNDGETLAIAAGRRITIRDHWRSAHSHDTTLSHPSPIRSMAFERDASRFAAATVDGRLFVWDWRRDAHTPLRRFAHGEFVTSVTFADDFIVTTGGNNAKVWDLRRAAGDPVAVLRGAARVLSTAIEPLENVLAMVSVDGLLQLWTDWNTAAPREIVRIRLGAAPQHDALQVAFAGDGRYLVSRRVSALEARLWRPSDLLAATCTQLRRNVADDVWARTCR